MSHALSRMRQAVREQEYRISSHANEEMSEDTLEAKDIEHIILTGSIARKFTHDPRGARYEVGGSMVDGRYAYVVCRFLRSNTLLIITAYAEDE